MYYKVSEQELENINLFVPAWFSEPLMTGMPEEDLKKIIKENLETAYQIADRKPLSEREFNEKSEDLYVTYLDVLKDYKVKEGK